MIFQVELNAKCGNCEHWEFMDKEDTSFLEDDETFCKLDNKPRKEGEECEHIKISEFQLRDNLISADYDRVKIIL